MLNSCFSISVIIFILLINIIVATDYGISDDNNQNLTRQCRSYEIEECMYQIWRDRNCEYGNGTGSIQYSLDEKDAETWTKFSMKFLQHYFTPEIVGDEIYLDFPENEFISTQNIDFEKNPENFGQYCFIQEAIKCFHEKSCDINDHNEILKELYSASRSVPKMLFHIIKQFINEKFGQVKNFFSKTFF